MDDVKKKPKPSVLGLGNALVDILIKIKNNKIIDQFDLKKGGMVLVDFSKFKKVYQATEANNKSITTGGSAANTIHAMACLGGKCGYMGKIGNDEFGEIFRDEFENRNIMAHLFSGEKATGRVMALITPDSERTMATYLGAAVELDKSDIDRKIFKKYTCLYIEGYLVQNHGLIESALKLAKEMGLKTVIDLASFNIVEENLVFLKTLVTKYVDIVFANEEESKAFTNKEPEEAIKILSEYCDTAIVKLGEKGSLIRKGDVQFTINPVPAKTVDSTGAGDSYAAGFLYGLTNNMDLEKCGKIASLVSAKMVQAIGAKIPGREWDKIKKIIKTL